MKALAIGGAADRVHILISLPATLSVAKALQLLKGILPNGHTILSRRIHNDASPTWLRLR
jgi:hypothetical protein